MNKPTRLILSGLILAGSALATEQGLAQSAPLSAEDWNADLDAFLTVLEAEHDNPFFHTPEAEFRAAVAEYRADLPDLNRAERIAALARIAALVGDGHTWMPMHALPFDGMPEGPGFRSLPVRFDVFEEGLFIVGALDADLAGARVVAFGDVPTSEAVTRAMALLPTDAVNFSREFLPEWLMQTELLAALGLSETADDVRLTIEQNGQVRDIALTPLPADTRYDWIVSQDDGPIGEASWTTAADATPLWRESVDRPWRTEVLEDAVYLQILQIGDGAQSYADMAAAAVTTAGAMGEPALVLDLRRCLGGDGTLNAGLMTALTESDALMQPGRLAVLTGRQTHSAAVMLVSDLERVSTARLRRTDPITTARRISSSRRTACCRSFTPVSTTRHRRRMTYARTAHRTSLSPTASSITPPARIPCWTRP
jgi:hypothetical protein